MHITLPKLSPVCRMAARLLPKWSQDDAWLPFAEGTQDTGEVPHHLNVSVQKPTASSWFMTLRTREKMFYCHASQPIKSAVHASHMLAYD